MEIIENLHLTQNELFIIAIVIFLIMIIMIVKLVNLKNKLTLLSNAKEELGNQLIKIQQQLQNINDDNQQLKLDNSQLKTLRASESASHEREINLLNKSHETAIQSLNDNQEKEINSLKENQQKEIDPLKQSHNKALEALTLAHKKEIEDLKQAQAETLQVHEKAANESLQAQKKSSQEAMQALELRFGETIKNATMQMKEATDKMLKERQQEFTSSSNTNLGQILTPLKETICKMENALQNNTEKHSKLCGELNSGLTRMLEMSERARKSTEELTNALKHGSKVQGDWGELVLDELLQSQGLTPGVHYDLQPTLRDAEGRRIKNDENSFMRPDVIIHLDDKREIIVDSKVSLKDYIDYVNAEDDKSKTYYLNKHVESIKKHVKELSRKSYKDFVKPPKICLNYVIMFVPNSGALWCALDACPDLWRKAMEDNVYIADEQSLYGALRIVSMTWTQITQEQNHQKIYELASEMMDRVCAFVCEFDNVGQFLDKAQNAHAKAYKKIKEGGQSIGTTCNKLLKLGVSVKQGSKAQIDKIIEPDNISLPLVNGDNLTQISNCSSEDKVE